MVFWKMAFEQKWVDAIELKGAVKTTANPFGEITTVEYKTITDIDFAA